MYCPGEIALSGDQVDDDCLGSAGAGAEPPSVLDGRCPRARTYSASGRPSLLSAASEGAGRFADTRSKMGPSSPALCGARYYRAGAPPGGSALATRRWKYHLRFCLCWCSSVFRSAYHQRQPGERPPWSRCRSSDPYRGPTTGGMSSATGRHWWERAVDSCDGCYGDFGERLVEFRRVVDDEFGDSSDAVNARRSGAGAPAVGWDGGSHPCPGRRPWRPDRRPGPSQEPPRTAL